MRDSNPEALSPGAGRRAGLTQKRALAIVLAVIALLLLKLILRERGGDAGAITEEVIEDLVKVVASA